MISHRRRRLRRRRRPRRHPQPDPFVDIPVDDLGLLIVPPIQHLPVEWRGLTQGQQDVALLAFQTSTNRHAEVTIERARRFELLKTPQRTTQDVTVKVPQVVKWDNLPVLNLLDMSSVYPWLRCFETQVMATHVTPEQRLEYFLDAPSSVDGTREDIIRIVGNVFNNYEDARRAFLLEYGYLDPVTAILSRLSKEAASCASTPAWKRLCKQAKIELALAHHAVGSPPDDIKVLTVAISAYDADRQQTLQTALKVKRVLPRVYDIIMAMFPHKWTTPITHTVEAPLLAAFGNNNFSRGGNNNNRSRQSAQRGRGRGNGGRMNNRPPRPQQQQPQQQQQQQQTSRNPNPNPNRPKRNLCVDCGYDTCQPGNCLAATKICQNCDNMGHLTHMCQKRRKQTQRSVPASSGNEGLIN